MLIQNTFPITQYDNLLTFCDTGEVFELKRDFLKMITKKNFKVDLASSSNNKIVNDFAKELYFDVKARAKNLLEIVLL